MAAGMCRLLFFRFVRALMAVSRTVEFETLDDLKRACQFLDQTEYRGYRVTCLPDVGFLPIPPPPFPFASVPGD
jgi:hypothetical protein